VAALIPDEKSLVLLPYYLFVKEKTAGYRPGLVPPSAADGAL